MQGIRAVGRAFSLLVVVSVVAAAQAPPREPVAAAATLDATADLAELFPATTVAYFETSGLASLLDGAGGVEGIYESIAEAMKGSGGSNELPLSLEEAKALSRPTIAAGFAQTGEALAVVRAGSAEEAVRLRPLVLRLLGQDGQNETRAMAGGVAVARFTAKGQILSRSEFAFASEGATLVLGAPALVEAAVARPRDEATLADGLDFAAARRRLTGHAAFAWYGVGAAFGRELDHVGPRELGLGALRAVSMSASAGGDGMLLVHIDRAKPGLVTHLATGPSVSLEAAALAPDTTQAFASFGLDAAGLVAWVDGLSAERRSGEAPAELAWLRAELEPRFGAPLAEVAAALGDEISVAVEFSPPAAAGARPFGEPHVLVFVEVREPTVARPALARLFAPRSGSGPAEVVEREHRGVTIATAGAWSSAVVNGVAIVGSYADVTRAIDAREAKATLAGSGEFEAALRGQVGSETLAAAFVSPKLALAVVENMLRSGALSGEDAAHVEAARDQAAANTALAVTVTKEELGMTVDLGAGGATAVGVVAAIAIPSLLRARRAANEASAVGTLRMLASAEATYKSRQGRYATIGELAAKGYVEFAEGGVRNAYEFRTAAASKTTFDLAAVPTGGLGGDRAFNVVEDYVIRYADGRTAPKRKAGKVLGADLNDDH
jgi:hypothetical protein